MIHCHLSHRLTQYPKLELEIIILFKKRWYEYEAQGKSMTDLKNSDIGLYMQQ